MKKIILLWGAAVVVLASCGSKSATTSSNQVSQTNSTTTAVSSIPSGPEVPLGQATTVTPPKDSKGNVASADLNAGKISYKNNCTKCHDLFSPKDFTREQWAPILVSMQKKAHLTDAEMAPITAYIYAQL
jgi:cytochrome c5